MPIYCYENEKTKEIVEKVFAMSEVPPTIEVDGELFEQVIVSPPSTTGSTGGSCWPMECVASGVHPDQAGELREHLRKHGVPTEVTPGGDPVYRSPEHRRRALKARGFIDKASYL